MAVLSQVLSLAGRKRPVTSQKNSLDCILRHSNGQGPGRRGSDRLPVSSDAGSWKQWKKLLANPQRGPVQVRHWLRPLGPLEQNTTDQRAWT